MKYLGINVTKFVHHLYEENYTTSTNKNKEELNKWRYSACLWIRRLSGVKMSVLLNLIYTFKGIPVKIPAGHFCGYWQTDSSIYVWGQETQNSQHNWRGTKLEDWHYLTSRLSIKRQSSRQCGIGTAAAAAAKSLQSCLTLCDPRDGSPPGSPVPGILQARTLEWVAISFSNAGKWEVKVKSLSRVWLLAIPWTAAHQAPPSMGFFQARVLEWGAIAFSSIGTRTDK